MPTTPKLLSYEEWLEIPEVGDAIEEVVNGEITIKPRNKWNHVVILKESIGPPGSLDRFLRGRDNRSVAVDRRQTHDNLHFS